MDKPSTKNQKKSPKNTTEPTETTKKKASRSKKSAAQTAETTSVKSKAPKSSKAAKDTKENKKAAKEAPVITNDTAPKTRQHRHVLLYIISSAAFCMAGFSAGYCVYDILQEEKPITVNYSGTDGNSTNFVEGSIAEVAARVTPGVVSIVTEIRSTGFFGQSYTSNAAGTGMIVSGNGYVLTNKHVIDGANAVQIVLDDGTTYSDVELAGVDPLNDVAFLKIKNAENLPTVKLGDSKSIAAGQQVIAIGNALGQYQNTITSGVISGTGRSLTATSSDYSTSETLTDMIQTDAAINSGNSGGPLVNAAGEVIGINTATSADADGIGFAIPISSVKGMLNNIVKNNKAERAYIGAYYITITPDIASVYDLPVNAGAYLYSASQYSAVIADGPAAKAGLKEKDIITKINGIKLGQAGSVSSIIGEYMPGDTIQLTVLRDGKEKTINLTLGSYSDKK